MRTKLKNPVVVGIDGSDDSQRAVRFAIEESIRRHVGIRLVHATHIRLAPVPAELNTRQLHTTARRIVEDTARFITELSDGEVEVEEVVAEGPTREVILDAAADATVIVLGPRDTGPVGHLFSGSTTVGVAARADCPVICVPSGWSLSRHRDRVLAGVDNSPATAGVLKTAFEEAARRAAALTVLYAWRLDNEYDAAVGSRLVVDQWREAARAQIVKQTAGWQEQFHDVKLDIELDYERPVVALARASADVDLVLVGRHGHGVLGLPIGSKPRALIRVSRAPVEITPPVAEERSRMRG